MCVACKRRVDRVDLERIIRNWLNQFDDPKNSDLDLDVEKFSGLGAETGLAYDIAFQIHQKVPLLILSQPNIKSNNWTRATNILKNWTSLHF